jgi:hypothetical protein
MIEGDDLELFADCHATDAHTGPDLDSTGGAGWHDALAYDRRAVVSMFEAQGSSNVRSSALDAVLLRAGLDAAVPPSCSRLRSGRRRAS